MKLVVPLQKILQEIIYDGTVENGSWTTDSTRSNVLEFNGIDTGIQTTGLAFLKDHIKDFSISFWIKPDNITANQLIFDFGATSDGNGIGIKITDSALSGDDIKDLPLEQKLVDLLVQ